MEPQIKNGEQVLISFIPYFFEKPKVNDIVAFKDGGNKILIKRIIQISKLGYFVQGDNKTDSLDSRKFGRITRKQIIGKIISKL